MLVKSVLTYLLLRWDYGLMAYAISSVVYSAVLNSMYYVMIPTAVIPTTKSVETTTDEEAKALVNEFS